MKQVLFIGCLVLNVACYAQDSTRRIVVAPNSIEQPVRPSVTLYRTIYYDANWNVLKNKKDAVYYRTPVIKDGDRYELQFFRINNTRLKTCMYLPKIVNYQLSLDEGIAVKDGYSTYYDEDGEKESEGKYVQDKKQGEWKYYKKGVIVATKMYEDDVEVTETK